MYYTSFCWKSKPDFMENSIVLIVRRIIKMDVFAAKCFNLRAPNSIYFLAPFHTNAGLINSMAWIYRTIYFLLHPEVYFCMQVIFLSCDHKFCPNLVLFVTIIAWITYHRVEFMGFPCTLNGCNWYATDIKRYSCVELFKRSCKTLPYFLNSGLIFQFNSQKNGPNSWEERTEPTISDEYGCCLFNSQACLRHKK